MDGAGFWDELRSDWIALDCELMPWSAKAQELLKRQYAAVAAAPRVGLKDLTETLSAASKRGLGWGNC